MAAEARAEIARANVEKTRGDNEDATNGRGGAFGQAIENSLVPTAGQTFDIYA